MLIAWLRMIILEVLSKFVVKNMDWEASEEPAHVVLIKTTFFFPLYSHSTIVHQHSLLLGTGMHTHTHTQSKCNSHEVK